MFMLRFFKAITRCCHCFHKKRKEKQTCPRAINEMRKNKSLNSHDSLSYLRLCVMITGADPKQEASIKRLNTGTSAAGVCVDGVFVIIESR